MKHTMGPKIWPFLDRPPLRAPFERDTPQATECFGGWRLHFFVSYLGIISDLWFILLQRFLDHGENLCCWVLELVVFRPTALIQLDSLKLRSGSQ